MQRFIDPGFDRPARSVDFSPGQSSRSLGSSLVRLALNGSDEELWALIQGTAERPQQVLAELAALYTATAERVAGELFSLFSAETSVRDVFAQSLSTAVREALLEQAGDAAMIFDDILDTRRAEYAQCGGMHRTIDVPLPSSVVFAFYKHLLAFGREIAILVMAELQLDQVESEVIAALTESAERAGTAAESAEALPTN